MGNNCHLACAGGRPIKIQKIVVWCPNSLPLVYNPFHFSEQIWKECLNVAVTKTRGRNIAGVGYYRHTATLNRVFTAEHAEYAEKVLLFG
jgi:hypothetical protein